MKDDMKLFRLFLICVICYIVILFLIAWVVSPVDGSGTIDLQGGSRMSVVQLFSSSKAGDVLRVSPVNFVIRKAAERNGIEFGSDDWFILLAIRKAENGRAGCEFGVKNPKAWDTDLDTQAGWASATIVKNRGRWDGNGDFIDFLADRYCPIECDPVGNKNWKRNVKYFTEWSRNDTERTDKEAFTDGP